MTSAEQTRRRALFKLCETREELWSWVYTFLDLDLPGVIVDEDSNTTPLDIVWMCYRHFTVGDDEMSRILFYASREGGKTLSEAVLETLVMVHMDLSVVHLAAVERQSTDAQGYLKGFFAKPDFKGFVQGDNTRTTEIIIYRKIGDETIAVTEDEHDSMGTAEQATYERWTSKAEIVVATMASVNGKHTPVVCLDEIDVMTNPMIYHEAVNIPTVVRRRGRIIYPLTIITSTRKTAVGFVQAEYGPVLRQKDEARAGFSRLTD